MSGGGGGAAAPLVLPAAPGASEEGPAEASSEPPLRSRGAEGSSRGRSAALVAPLRFTRLAPEHQAEEKALVLTAMEGHSAWHREIRGLIPKHQIKLSCSSSECGRFVASHLTLHNDFKLVQLGRDHGFPRGFCLVVDREARSVIGQGTFYPKFANDARNESFLAKDFGDVSSISCFLKYSGSTGIITILRDANGRVCGWTGSSKNSCSHEASKEALGPLGAGAPGFSYPAEIVAIFSKHATNEFLAWCERHGITSLGLEVFIAKDQTHGYGYAQSGLIVTAVAVEGSEHGRLAYLSPQQLFQVCSEVGLPTDRPLLVDGNANVMRFVESLSGVRDLLTLSALRVVLRSQCGIELETLHDKLVDSEIIEGFVIRRWMGDEEIPSVKFKIWLYQMVTQVLRPCLRVSKDGTMMSLKERDGRLSPDFRKAVEKELPKWCTASNASTLKLCKWVVEHAAKAALPQGHPQLTAGRSDEDGEAACQTATARLPAGCVAPRQGRAYWITLGEHAVSQLGVRMAAAGWDPKLAVSGLASPPTLTS